ncbi:uncharacterized protein ACIB01_006894 [Guaruba guarouba]
MLGTYNLSFITFPWWCLVNSLSQSSPNIQFLLICHCSCSATPLLSSWKKSPNCAISSQSLNTHLSLKSKDIQPLHWRGAQCVLLQRGVVCFLISDSIITEMKSDIKILGCSPEAGWALPKRSSWWAGRSPGEITKNQDQDKSH